MTTRKEEEEENKVAVPMLDRSVDTKYIIWYNDNQYVTIDKDVYINCDMLIGKGTNASQME
jgi:hypothetical protein